MFKIKIHKAPIILLVLCFFSTTAVSQTVYSNKPSSSFSFTVGLTNTDLINNTNSYKSGILFNAGFIYSVNVSGRINVAMECLYTGKAVKRDAPLIKYRFFYIDVPLYLQVKLNGDNLRFNMGAQYSLFTNSQAAYLDSSKKNGINTANYHSIKDNDFGILLGAEIDITKDLTIAARYTLSGSTFFNKSQVNFGVFQLSFNYNAFRTYKQLFHKKEAVTN